VEAARIEVEEAARSLSRYAESISADGARLAEVDERLASLRRVARKHGGSVEAALVERERLAAELAGIEGASSRVGELEAALPALRSAAEGEARTLSAARRRAAGRLAAAASEELASLGMRDARLSLRFAPHPGGLGPRGAEEAELMLAANVGEQPGPLSRVASGGELSRVLLALRRALAAADPVRTWVFDEIDAGISGATALAVGRMLREVARERQVLCVTHLPQVAAFAEVHLHVTKDVRAGRTFARVEALATEGQRARQLASLLSGGGGAAVAAAQELLLLARRGGKKRRAA
jgi:DNA repair protein RecN (Recombination protein N)